MSNDEPAVLTERQGHVLVITLNRPRIKNAVNMAMAAGLEAAIDELEADPDLWVGVLTGSGGAFCAGADLTEAVAGQVPQTDRRGLLGFLGQPPDKTVIAAVEGMALGGGFEMCLACDLIVASREAKMGLPEARHSLMALAGGLVRLPRRAPYHLAMEMALTGESKGAEALAGMGVVNRVCDAGTALETAVSLANQICRNGPIAVNSSRRIIKAAGTIGDEADVWAFQAEEATLESLMSTEDFHEGITAFLEKREPVWQNR